MDSPDRASRSSAHSDQTAVSTVGSGNGGGARLTPAPDIVSQLPGRAVAAYRPPHHQTSQTMQQGTQVSRGDDVASGDRGHGTPIADHKYRPPFVDQGSGSHRGTANRPGDHEVGSIIVGPSMIRNPGVQESALGYPPPVLTQRLAPATMQSFSMHPPPPRSMQAPPSTPPGPLPSRVAQLRAAHAKSSQSLKQQCAPKAQSVGSEDAIKEMLDSIAAIHSRLHGLTQGTLRNPELPKSYRDGFQVDTQHLTRSLFELANKIESRGQAMASLEKENVELRKTNNSLETTLTEAIEEVSRLNHELVDEAKKSHRFQDALTMAEQKARQDQYKISDLEDRCTRLNEQVDNKRSLWMQVHTDPKDRARAMSQHAQSQKSASIYGQDSPMEPPSISGSWRPRITGGPGPMSNTHQPSTSRTIGHRTSQSQLRLAPPRLPIGSGRGSQFGTSSVHSSIGNLSDVRPRSVLGSQYSGRQMDIARRSDLSLSFGNLSARDQESDRKTSLFSRRLPDDFPATTEAGSPVKKNPLSKEWEGKFTKLWTMIFGFCGGYASGPSKKDVPTHLKSKAPELWKELCLSISPTNEQRAAERIAYSLFRDPNARKYLTQRYLTQFLVALAFDVSWYLGFSDDLDEEIRELAAELKANGANAQERAETLRRQRELVGGIRRHPKFPKYLQWRLQESLTELTSVAWNLVPDDISPDSRAAANHDLFAVADAAVRLAGEAMLSEHEFTFGWHRAGAPFTAAAHVAVNTPAGVSERGGGASDNLRLRLGITPTVTARVLEGMHIVPLLAQRAQVLLAN